MVLTIAVSVAGRSYCVLVGQTVHSALYRFSHLIFTITLWIGIIIFLILQISKLRPYVKA